MKALIPILLTLPLLSGCDTLTELAEPRLSEQEQATLDDYEARIGVLEGEINDAQAAGLQAVKDRDMAALEAASVRFESSVNRQREYAVAGAKILEDAKESKMTGFMRLASHIPGPWQPLIPVIGTIATTLLGRRSRKFAWVTVKDSLKVGLWDTVKNAARAVGMEHSSEASKAAAIADPTTPIEA